jgi:hypothetical protein
MCNGADSVYTFDGTTWTDRSAAITERYELDPHQYQRPQEPRLVHPEGHAEGVVSAYAVHYRRGGALDLSAFASMGGYLMAMGTWTIDAGYGVDDLAVFITNMGEVIVYRGTDPSSATTWGWSGYSRSAHPSAGVAS